MKWFLDDTKNIKYRGKYLSDLGTLWIDESHDLSQKVPSREVLSTVPRLRGGFISYRHLFSSS